MSVLLRQVAFQREGDEAEVFPWTVPVLRDLERVEFPAPVTILAGENGTGKSTLIEALAVASDRIAAGGADLKRDESLHGARRLARSFRLTWSRKTGRGFFLRAEDFFRYVRRLQGERAELVELERDFSEGLTGYGRMLATGSARGQRQALETRYEGDLDERSHGESFLSFFRSRIVPEGLYLLDEPEAALSPQRQLALLALMRDSVAEGSQFIMATHSPVLMACPDAAILSLDEDPPRIVPWDELEHVNFMRDFLDAPERFLRHL